MSSPCALLCLLSLAASLSGCALPSLTGPVPAEPAREAAAGLRETVLALTEDQQLLRFAADRPQEVLQRQAVRGLAPGEKLLGIDFRVARGELYGLASSGRLYRIDPASASAQPVGETGIGWPLLGARVAIDFNPTVDRLRVVTEAGQNLRVHPDTGLLVDREPQVPGLQPDLPLGYVNGDPHAGLAPRIVGAGYTYNKRDDKLTTLYGIDLGLAQLVMMGSHESKVPPVSPNTGRVMSVGPLGVVGLVEADLDISDLDNTPLALLRTDRSRLYRIDLATGRAQLIGVIGDGAPVRSIAIEP